MDPQLNHKTILVFPFNLMAHYLRCISLAKGYSDYNILFQASSKYSKYVKSASFGVFDTQHFDAGKVLENARMFKFDWLNEKDLYRVLRDQIEVINTFNPEFVIGYTAPTLKMACEITETKYVSLMNGYMSKYYALARPLPEKHFLGNFLNRLPKKLRALLLKIGGNLAFYYVHTPFKKIRKQLHLKSQRTYLDELEGDENLICDRPYLFPQKNLPDNYRIIGPLLYTSSDSEEDILSELNQSKKTICVCMGSTGNWTELAFLSHDFFSKFNVITAGDNKQIITGRHVIKKNFLNLDAVLPVCDYFICHGGNGTIYKALAHKVPLFCLSAHFEQEWNAKRMEELGLGKNISGSARETLYSLNA